MNRWNRPGLALPLLGLLLTAGRASAALAASGPTTLSGTYSSIIVDWPKGKTGTISLTDSAALGITLGTAIDESGHFSITLPTSEQIGSLALPISGLFTEKSNYESNQICKGQGAAKPTDAKYWSTGLKASIEGGEPIYLKLKSDTHLPYPVGQGYSNLTYFSAPTVLNGNVTCSGYVETLRGTFPAGWSLPRGVVTAISATSYADLFTSDPLPTNVTWHLYDLSAGIGVRLDAKVAGVPGITISDVAAGRPAERAGVKVADRLVEIDGKDVSAMSSDQVVSLLRGAANTTVTIGIQRGAETTIRQFNLIRAEIQIP